MQFLFSLTLTFDLDVILTEKGQHFKLEKFNGPTMYGSKIVGVFKQT